MISFITISFIFLQASQSHISRTMQQKASPPSINQPSNDKEDLDKQKLSLEIKELEFKQTWIGRWSGTATTFIALMTGAVALFSGLSQQAKVLNESITARTRAEQAQIVKAFTLIGSENVREVKTGALNLVNLVDNPKLKESIYPNLRGELAALQPIGETDSFGVHDFEVSQINAILPIVQSYPDERRNELYSILLGNPNFKTGKIAILKAGGGDKKNWEEAINSTSGPYVLSAVEALAQSKLPYAEDLLIIALKQDQGYPPITEKASQALGNLKSKNAVQPLINVLVGGVGDVRRRAAAQALGEIGDPRAIFHLEQACASSNDKYEKPVYRAALMKLGKTNKNNQCTIS